MSAYYIRDEIKSLVKHIEQSFERSKERKSLWDYFGITQKAAPLQSEHNLESKIDYLIENLAQIEFKSGQKI